MPGVSTPIATEVARDGIRGVTANRYRFLFGVMKIFRNLTEVLVVQTCDYILNYTH